MNGNTKGDSHWWAIPYEDDTVAQLYVSTFPDGMTYEDIGEAIGVTRQRSEQILYRALAKIRRTRMGEKLKRFVPDAEPVRVRRSQGRYVQTGHIGMEYPKRPAWYDMVDDA